MPLLVVVAAAAAAAVAAISSSNSNKNSSGDEIANVNFYAVHPEAIRIRWNNAK